MRSDANSAHQDLVQLDDLEKYDPNEFIMIRPAETILKFSDFVEIVTNYSNKENAKFYLQKHDVRKWQGTALYQDVSPGIYGDGNSDDHANKIDVDNHDGSEDIGTKRTKKSGSASNTRNRIRRKRNGRSKRTDSQRKRNSRKSRGSKVNAKAVKKPRKKAMGSGKEYSRDENGSGGNQSRYRSCGREVHVGNFCVDDWRSNASLPKNHRGDGITGNSYSGWARFLALRHSLIWLAKGMPTYGPIHYDEYENLYAVISGTKTFEIFHPMQSINMYERVASYRSVHLLYEWFNSTGGKFWTLPIESSTRNRMPFSPVNISAPDYNAFPLFKEARKFTCELQPGDLLYLPSYWWHEVRGDPPSDAASCAGDGGEGERNRSRGSCVCQNEVDRTCGTKHLCSQTRLEEKRTDNIQNDVSVSLNFFFEGWWKKANDFETMGLNDYYRHLHDTLYRDLELTKSGGVGRRVKERVTRKLRRDFWRRGEAVRSDSLGRPST